MQLKDIIKTRRKELNLTLAEIAKACNVSEATVSRWESGDIGDMKRSRIAALSKVLKVSPSIIVGTSEDEDSSDSFRHIKGILPIPEVRQEVPMLGSIACGKPIYMDEERGEYFPLDARIHADFCLRAEGDSMTGARICDGDIVFIQAVPEVENGSIAAVAIDDEATLKYFFQYGDTVVLRPANPKYQEMTYSQDDLNRVRVLGRAVAFQSGL